MTRLEVELDPPPSFEFEHYWKHDFIHSSSPLFQDVPLSPPSLTLQDHGLGESVEMSVLHEFEDHQIASCSTSSSNELNEIQTQSWTRQAPSSQELPSPEPSHTHGQNISYTGVSGVVLKFIDQNGMTAEVSKGKPGSDAGASDYSTSVMHVFNSSIALLREKEPYPSVQRLSPSPAHSRPFQSFVSSDESFVYTPPLVAPSNKPPPEIEGTLTELHSSDSTLIKVYVPKAPSRQQVQFKKFVPSKQFSEYDVESLAKEPSPCPRLVQDDLPAPARLPPVQDISPPISTPLEPMTEQCLHEVQADIVSYKTSHPLSSAKTHGKSAVPGDESTKMPKPKKRSSRTKVKSAAKDQRQSPPPQRPVMQYPHYPLHSPPPLPAGYSYPLQPPPYTGAPPTDPHAFPPGVFPFLPPYPYPYLYGYAPPLVEGYLPPVSPQSETFNLLESRDPSLLCSPPVPSQSQRSTGSVPAVPFPQSEALCPQHTLHSWALVAPDLSPSNDPQHASSPHSSDSSSINSMNVPAQNLAGVTVTPKGNKRKLLSDEEVAHAPEHHRQKVATQVRMHSAFPNTPLLSPAAISMDTMTSSSPSRPTKIHSSASNICSSKTCNRTVTGSFLCDKCRAKIKKRQEKTKQRLKLEPMKPILPNSLSNFYHSIL